MKREILNALLAAGIDKQSVALVTNIESGIQCLVYADSTLYQCDEQHLDPQLEIVDAARRCLAEQRSVAVKFDNSRILIRTYAPPPRLIVIGAVHIAQSLLPMAELAGFHVYLIDPRTAFGAEERFPGIDVIHQWPDQALESLSLDSSSAVVTLSHDPKIDDPALKVALESEAFYVGALGSKRTHAARLRRMSESGVDADARTRIHAPIGLPLGGRKPSEIAVSILAQIIEKRYQRRPEDPGQHANRSLRALSRRGEQDT